MRRLLLVLVLVGGVLVVARGVLPCATMPLQPTCWVALEPGPAEDALALTRVAGTTTYDSAGELLLTTVAVDSDLDLVEWFRNAFDPSIDQVERERVFPPGADDDEVRRENAVLMEVSQLDATLAALTHLGYDVDAAFDGAEVVALAEVTSVDDGQLEPGDVIVAVDGEPTPDNTTVGEAVRSRAVGDTVELTFRRGDRERTTEVDLIASPDDASVPIIGVLLVSHVELPVDVDIDAGVIGGPSAGLAFSLALVDLLGEDDLTGGEVVAASGTIEPDGTVGPVGGITQKVVGALTREGGPPATVFLVPRGNFEAARAAPATSELLLVPVDRIDDAVAALRDLREGRVPAEAFALGTGS